MGLFTVLRFLSEETEFAYRGEPSTAAEYKESLTWHGPGNPPSWSDVQAVWDEAHTSDAFRLIRFKRNDLLAACDWTQIPGACKTAVAWESYRQKLRDLPATITDPTQPFDWPEPPNSI